MRVDPRKRFAETLKRGLGCGLAHGNPLCSLFVLIDSQSIGRCQGKSAWRRLGPGLATTPSKINGLYLCIFTQDSRCTTKPIRPICIVPLNLSCRAPSNHYDHPRI